jgi:hypothetical protein
MDAEVNPLESTGDTIKYTALGSLASERDVSMSMSFAGIVNSQGEASIDQGGAGAIIVQGPVEATRSGAVAIVASSVNSDHAYSAVAVGSDVSLRRSWIGVALSPRMQVSEDSRVIIGPMAALIIAVAIFGLFGIAAALGVVVVRRAMTWRPKVPSVSWHRMGE